jgi:cytoskeletal protein RodZ
MNSTETFFNALKAHRESKDIKIEDISEATRINPKYFEAIETGDFTVLPAVYMRLFLRSYANHIGADSEKALEDYELHTTGQVIQKTDEPRPSVLKDDEETEEIEFSPDFQITPQKIATAVGAILLIFLFFKLVGSLTSEQELDTKAVQPVEVVEQENVDDSTLNDVEPEVQYSTIPNNNLLNESNFLESNLVHSRDDVYNFNPPFEVEIQTLTQTKINLSHGDIDNLKSLFNGIVQADTTLSFQFDSVLYFDLWSGQHINLLINENQIENLTDDTTVRGSYDSKNSQMSLKFYKH